MKISRIVNKLLAHANLAMVKKSSLDSLEGALHRSQSELNSFRRRGNENSIFHRDLIRNQIAQKWSTVDFMWRIHQSKLEQRQCPLCGHEDDDQEFAKIRAHCAFGGGDLLRHVCPVCEVIFGPDKMLQLTPQELSQEYEWHYRVYKEGDSTEQEILAFHALNPKMDGVYLNYGAGGWSKSVQILRDEGWNVMAFEPHSSASVKAEYLINSREKLRGMRFDGLFSNNVLEHLRYPEKELSEMATLLKLGGRMAHATPCYQYLYEYTRFHLFFFTGKSRKILMHKAGLREVDYLVNDHFMCSVVESVQE